MSNYTEHLTQLRRQEQETRGYATSSRWYTGLSNAISFLERAENDSDSLDSFRDAWAAIYNLFMMYGESGDDEFKRFNRWVTEVKEIPEVRRIFQDAPLARFSTEVEKAKRALLYDTEKRQWREGYQYLNVLSTKTTTSIDKRIRYFLVIIRDIRNACGHPEFNPKNASTKKALVTAVNCLIPVVAAATQAMIEHPVEGTTGRTTAYRSFLWPFVKNVDSFFQQ